MKCFRLVLLVIFLISAAPLQSNASFVEIFRKLTEQDRLHPNTSDQVSPAPSPFSSANLSSDNAPAPVNSQKPDSCQMVPEKCDVKDYNITACIPSVGNGSQASYVLVVNGGDTSHKLHVTISPLNSSVEDIVHGHELKKVNLPPNAAGSSSILLHVENQDCIIHLGAHIPESFYTGHLTPINGMYLLLATFVFIGGTWACCKFGRKGRHLDGVPYQELEMGQQESNPSFTIGSPEGWDENWDDDNWDEEKAVISPGTNHARKNIENGGSLKYVDTSQWGNDWDD